jgi:hypothetical protein
MDTQTLQQAARERQVHATREIAMVLDEGVERAIAEADLAGRLDAGLVAARLQGLYQRAAQSALARPRSDTFARCGTDRLAHPMGWSAKRIGRQLRIELLDGFGEDLGRDHVPAVG